MLQVKTDFRKVVRKMVSEDDYVTALTELSSYGNSEGIFGDPVVMTMTEDGHKNQIPTYQFWSQEGALVSAIIGWGLIDIIEGPLSGIYAHHHEYELPCRI